MASDLLGTVRAFSEDVAYVSWIAADGSTLKNVDIELLGRLPGRTYAGRDVVLSIGPQDAERAGAAAALRALGLLCANGSGWSPAQLLQDRRNRGFLDGLVPVIS